MRRVQLEHFQRVLIFGNGGTGKTWLARQVGKILGRPAIHLDDVRWLPGQYGVARDRLLVVNEVIEAGKADTWLMEGVYGWLANAVLDRVTTLVWIDLPEEECVANVRARGIQGGGSQESFEAMIEWVQQYRSRENSATCYSSHRKLFDACAAPKVILKNRADVCAYVDQLRDVAARF